MQIIAYLSHTVPHLGHGTLYDNALKNNRFTCPTAVPLENGTLFAVNLFQAL